MVRPPFRLSPWLPNIGRSSWAPHKGPDSFCADASSRQKNPKGTV